MFVQPAEVLLSKLSPALSLKKNADCAFTRQLELSGTPQVRHHHPDDIMRKNACGMTKTSPGLTFRPAADETDPRVHVFVSFPYRLHM